MEVAALEPNNQTTARAVYTGGNKQTPDPDLLAHPLTSPKLCSSRCLARTGRHPRMNDSRHLFQIIPRARGVIVEHLIDGIDRPFVVNIFSGSDFQEIDIGVPGPASHFPGAAEIDICLFFSYLIICNLSTEIDGE